MNKQEEAMDSRVTTLCDRCGREIPQEEASDGFGEFEEGTLCLNCAAVLALEQHFEELKEREAAHSGTTGGRT